MSIETDFELEPGGKEEIEEAGIEFIVINKSKKKRKIKVEII